MTVTVKIQVKSIYGNEDLEFQLESNDWIKIEVENEDYESISYQEIYGGRENE